MKHQQTLTVYVNPAWKTQNGVKIGSAVLMTEGIRCGSDGCKFYAGHILQQFAREFEGVPATLNHPMVNGSYVSVNEKPDAIIGTVKNTRYDPIIKGVRAEIHVPANHPKIKEIMKIKEISIGVFADEVYRPGTWKGRQYDVCPISLEADHVALLPNERGACSYDRDGCGLRANSANAQIRQILADEIANFINHINKGGYTMNNEVEPLLPPGVGTKEKEPQGQAGSGYGRSPEPEQPRWNGGGVEPMLPTGLNK